MSERDLHEIKVMLETLLRHTWVVLDEAKPDEFTSLYALAQEHLCAEIGVNKQLRQHDLRNSRCEIDYPEALDEAIAYQIAHKDVVPIGEDGIFYVRGRAFSVNDGDD